MHVLPAEKKEKKKKVAEGGDTTEPSTVFSQSPAAGIPPGNTAAALSVLRTLAADYHVTAEHVDLLAELFDDVNHKV